MTPLFSFVKKETENSLLTVNPLPGVLEAAAKAKKKKKSYYNCML